MRQTNLTRFGKNVGPFQPERHFGEKSFDLKSAALRFLHNRCEGLKFDSAKEAEEQKKRGEHLLEEPIYDFDDDLFAEHTKPDESPDRTRTIRLTEEKDCYILCDKSRGNSETAFKTYRQFNRDKWTPRAKFVDSHGRIVVIHGSDIDFYNAETGCSLLVCHHKIDMEGDKIYGSVRRFSSDGYVDIHDYMSNNWVRLPDPDVRLDYHLSRVVSFREHEETVSRLIRDYPEAEKAFGQKDYRKALSLLSPYSKDGTLFLYQPALVLRERLFPYCTAEKLITVLPQEHAPSENPCPVSDLLIPKKPEEEPKVKDEASDGDVSVFVSESTTMKENPNNSMDVDYVYALRASKAGRQWFWADRFSTDSECDSGLLHHGMYVMLRGNFIRNKKENWDEYFCHNPGDIAYQIRTGLTFSLPGAYSLRNTRDGVMIGGFLFDDVFSDFAPLYDSQRIVCEKKTYRLIYQYGDVRAVDGENTSVSASDDSSVSCGGEDVSPVLNDKELPLELYDQFRVLSEPYFGGMGNVWKVCSQFHPGNVYAMKRPNSAYLASDRENRLKRTEEQYRNWDKLTGLRRNPNIVICNFCRKFGGVPYIFTEWIDGGNLRDRIRDGSLYSGSAEEVRDRLLRIASRKANGLKFAHSMQILHLDIKPANIMLTPDWEATLNDFGYSMQTDNGGTARKAGGYTPAYSPAK